MKKKILVTGGAGFLGNEVVQQLLDKSYQVRVADNLSKTQSITPKDCEFLRIDLSNKKATLRAMDGMDYCIHLAAKIGGIGYFHKYPATILAENNKMYSAIFESAVEKNIKRIIYISSSMVFESTKFFPSKEKDIEKVSIPISAYGFSKLIGEWYCRSFKEQFDLNYTIIRPFNAYGIKELPGEEIGYAHVIPDLIKKVISGQYPMELLGNGKQIRCFTHVSDVAKGIILALESAVANNEDFNIGSDEEIKIRDLAKIIWKMCGRKETFRVKSMRGFKYDVLKRVSSSYKARILLGWKEEKKLEQELPMIINWIKAQLAIKKVS